MIQVSLEVPDRPGELSRVVQLLGDHDVDIKALYLSRTNQLPPKGQVRMIVTDPALATRVLKEGGLLPFEEKVIVVSLDDHPGGMAQALLALSQRNINLDYVYGFVSRIEGRALSILGVANVVTAAEVLVEAGFRLVDHVTPPAQEEDLTVHLGGVWNW